MRVLWRHIATVISPISQPVVPTIAGMNKQSDVNRMKPLKIKMSLTLDEKDQAKRASVIEAMKRYGLPEMGCDSYIYRVGLDAAHAQTLSPENDSQNKPKQNE